MNYSEQRSFLLRYKIVAVVYISLFVAGLFVYATKKGISLLEVLLSFALVYCYVYLPKYLSMTVEKAKKYYWTVKIRWILSGVLLAAGFFDFVYWLAAAAVFSSNFAMRLVFKRSDLRSEPRWPAAVYLLVDCAVILFLSSEGSLLRFLLLLLASHLALQLRLVLPLALVVGIANFSWFILPHLVLTLFSWTMTRMASKQAEANYRRTVEELVEFTSDCPQKVETLLVTSTAKLAEDWQAKRPTTRQEVEKWYVDNSAYYIYDLAQFHLSYKHIVFTMDILRLAKGRVLDYGGGIGDLSIALAKQGNDVTYLDVEGRSKEYARWQAKKQGVSIRFVSSHEEIASDSFDTIILLDVLEHLYEPQPVLDFLVDRLSVAGMMILSAYFGATKAHPMHFDHEIDVYGHLLERGFVDAKEIRFKLFCSEAMRRSKMYVLRKCSSR
ncbi:MAG: methyltransferase domain-containing protein [Acidobacteriota bacterium]|nr:methyltransferase domain-containing protein [Blastocatellia bacterium]MDW8412277.1 methyltransferase domain-containing protein [Acidobacteriota bacterium]